MAYAAWRWRASLGLLAILAVGFATLVVVQGKTEPTSQQLRLEARDTRFNGNNPILEMRRGGPVELTVHNAESDGVSHDLLIAGLEVRTGILKPGESATLRFTPEHLGEYPYACSLHPGLMDGRVAVRE